MAGPSASVPPQSGDQERWDVSKGFNHTQDDHRSLKEIYLKTEQKKALVFQNQQPAITRKLNTSPEAQKYKTHISTGSLERDSMQTCGNPRPKSSTQAKAPLDATPVASSEVTTKNHCLQWKKKQSSNISAIN